ncbi:hypothetical protein BVC80_8587g19 [Macleaya cordata]|uniref:RNase H type-1 domain-containing protein n=1 Tax=Macleaya cordata TaxID=56857 RepID=A0A200RAH9_MACCD|nr:hypothetical protein BVC80_8587g19 [Macleaya cordata]
MDASFKDFKFAAAAVARDPRGNFMGCTTKIGWANSVDCAELSAFLLGLEFPNRFTNLKIRIEGDSLKVVTWINDPTSNIPWNLLAQVRDARALVSSSDVTCVSFVHRYCNSVADSLATFAFSCSADDVWSRDFPPTCIEEVIAIEQSSLNFG